MQTQQTQQTQQVEMELQTLRREVSELRLGLQSLEAHHKDESDAYWEPVGQRMKAEMEKDNKPGVVGVLRAAIFLQSSGGHNVYSSVYQFGDLAKLPPVEKLIELGNALSDPTGLHATYLIYKRHFEDRQMSMSKSELATALGVAEEDVERALLPLVGNGTLRWSKNADANESYQLERPDLFATLLTLI